MPDEEKGEIGFYIDRTYKVVRQDLLNEFKKDGIDLTPEQWVVLSRLENKKNLSQSKLVNTTFKDKHTLSRILDLLDKKGYLIRKIDKNDKRKAILLLTSKGVKTIEKAHLSVNKSRERGWSNLSQKEYLALIEILNKVFESYSDE